MRKRLFLLLLLGLAVFEAGALTGFSWKRLAYVPEAEIVDAAIRFSYPDIYADLRALQADYSGFRPQVRYWGSWNLDLQNGLIDKLFGFQRYQVRLPEEIVIVDADGKALFSRADTACNDERGCPKTPPDHPETGIVGTVQHGEPGYEAAQAYTVAWEGVSQAAKLQDTAGQGRVFTAGHCFSASITSKGERSLVVDVPGDGATTLRQGFGYHLVAVMATGHYARVRISKAEFERSRSCSPEARAAWPNVGGAAWKR
jgi:hypothetical protein